MAGILIVDDDPSIRAMFARALGALGEIEQAANGGDALRLLAVKKFGVILLDLHMPVMDGFVVLHTLANKPGPNKDTPIYVITADTSDQARIRALRRHAVFLLTKPVPIATLTALVDAALKKSILRAQVARDAADAKAPAQPGKDTPSSRPPGTPRAPKKPGA